MRCALVVLLLYPSGLAAAPDPLAEARQAVVPLERWRFQTDPKDDGSSRGFATAALDDARWPQLVSGKPWTEQGYKGYVGVAWYRIHVAVPASWKDSPVRLRSEGVDSEYDVYVNGSLARHFGPSLDIPNESPTQAEIGRYLKFGADNVIAVRVRGAGGLLKRIMVRRVLSLGAGKELLPAPVLDAHPAWVDLYWETWRLTYQNLAFGTSRNGLASAYMDEGYNDDIYQWDSIFMSLFGRYGQKLFPATATLDNFYRKQDRNGYIQRIYSETTGLRPIEPNDETTMTNPPLFAWAEWEHYRYSGDKARLAKVFGMLERYDAWLEANERSPLFPELYWSTGFESGMDNMPRPNATKAGWVDFSLQQALAARSLQQIAHELGKTDREDHWRKTFEARKAADNKQLWSEKDGIYYDVDRAGHHTGVRHIGAMWALLAGVADAHQTERLVAHLRDPREFYRKHMFPALAASDAGYTKTSTYWQGGVWAPTNYMTIHGLMAAGFEDLAYEAALNHIDNMAKVFATKIDEGHIDPNEADGDYATIWECYSPDETRPCTRADTVHYGRQDFAGWTGLGPVALLVEQAIGMEIVGAEHRVIWRLREPGRVGLERFSLATDTVSLVAEPAAKGGARKISATAGKPFKLEVVRGTSRQTFDVRAGTSTIELP